MIFAFIFFYCFDQLLYQVQLYSKGMKTKLCRINEKLESRFFEDLVLEYTSINSVKAYTNSD